MPLLICTFGAILSERLNPIGCWEEDSARCETVALATEALLRGTGGNSRVAAQFTVRLLLLRLGWSQLMNLQVERIQGRLWVVKVLSIVPNFRIPKGYRRRFLFSTPKGRFWHEIVADEDGIHTRTRGHAGAVTNSRCLDWIQESIERVRFECSK